MQYFACPVMLFMPPLGIKSVLRLSVCDHVIKVCERLQQIDIWMIK